MKRIIVKAAIPLLLVVIAFVSIAGAGASGNRMQPVTKWQSPPEELLEVLHAPQLPWVWTAPTGEYLLLADPVLYPPLAELAAPMHKLAGIRVNPATNGRHGSHGGTSPRLVRVEDGITTPIVCRQNLFDRTVHILRDGFDNFKLKPVPSCFAVFSALKSAF